MVSGTDDQVWPCEQMSELAMERLRRHKHRYEFEHLIYEGAGHCINAPFWPTTIRQVVHPVYGQVFVVGGTAAADARADEDSWPKILAFLDRAVRA